MRSCTRQNLASMPCKPISLHKELSSGTISNCLHTLLSQSANLHHYFALKQLTRVMTRHLLLWVSMLCMLHL